MATGHPVVIWSKRVDQKKQKLKPTFSDDTCSNETEYESDPELAILEAMERSSARLTAKRNSTSGKETQKPQMTQTKVMKATKFEKEGTQPSSGNRILNDTVVSKEAAMESMAELENTWDEAVQALDVDDITAFISTKNKYSTV